MACCSLVDPVVSSLLCLLALGLCGGGLSFNLFLSGGSTLLVLFLALCVVCMHFLFFLRLCWSLNLFIFSGHTSAFNTNRPLRLTIVHEEVLSGGLLDLILLRLVLVDTRTEVVGVSSERDVHHLQESVHASDKAFRCRCISINSWGSTEHNDLVSKVSCHDEIVLNNKGCTLSTHDPAFQDASCENTLLRIQIRGRLIDKVQVTRLGHCNDQGDTL